MAFTLSYPRQFRSDIALCLVILIHILITFALNTYIESAMPFAISSTAYTNALWVTLVTLFMLLATLCIRVVNSRLLKRPYGFISTDYFMGVVVYLAFGYLLGSFIVFKIMMSEMLPFTWDAVFADLDQRLHFKDPWRYLTFLDPYYQAIVWIYSVSWHLIISLTTYYICVSRSPVRFRYLWTTLCTWIIGGNIIPMIFMAAGPVFVERLTGSTRFSELSDRLYAQADLNVVGSRLPDLLWTAYETGTPFFGSGISAFPSLHVAFSTLLYLTARHYGRWISGAALAYLIFTMLGSVHLGWHYAIDGYFSIALVCGFWVFWKWVEAKQKPLKA